MARMPGALWRPISKNIGGARNTRRGLILHTAAGRGSAGGANHYRYWNREKTGSSSHFFVDYDGTIWQFADTTIVTWSSGAANGSTIGVETQGQGYESWTPAQCASLARIIAWASKLEGWPIQLMPDSKPGRTGVGYHRLGVNPWRVGSGETWSSSYGKVCPGDKRIAQIPGILRTAGGPGGAVKPAPKTSIKPKIKPGGHMGTVDDMAGWRDVFGRNVVDQGQQIWSDLQEARKNIAGLERQIQILVDRTPAVRRGKDRVPMIQEIADTKTHVLQSEAKIDRLLTATTAGGVDADALARAIAESIIGPLTEALTVAGSAVDPRMVRTETEAAIRTVFAAAATK